MKSQMLRSVAELFIVLLGALLLSVHSVQHVVAVVAAVPTLPATAYGVGELTGQFIGALFPLLVGIGLVVIAYRRGFISRVRVRGA